MREHQGVILTLVTENVDDWYRKLRDAGVEIKTAPAQDPQYNIYHFFFRDPNGYLLEIQRFHDPKWK